MTDDDDAERVPTTPRKRHSSTRLVQLAESVVGDLVVTDSHTEAAYVTALVKFKLGIRKVKPTEPDDETWPMPTRLALQRQADVIVQVVIRGA